MIIDSTMNSIANANNKFQGDSKRVLCVCSAGMLRSPTAQILLNREFGYNTRSAGIADYALIPLSRVLVEWADQIVFVDKRVYNEFKSSLDAVRDNWFIDLTTDIVVLNIPDDFVYMDEELQRMILVQYRHAVKKLT